MPALRPAQLKRLMGCFATGVAVVTLRDSRGGPAGMTASAISSVSLEPPLLLVCVSREAEFHAAMLRTARFAINILAEDQEHVSKQFSAEDTDRFGGIGYVEGPGGVPVLPGTVAHITCDSWGRREAGDHTVFFGKITGGASTGRAPLLHFRGRYARTGP